MRGLWSMLVSATPADGLPGPGRAAHLGVLDDTAPRGRAMIARLPLALAALLACACRTELALPSSDAGAAPPSARDPAAGWPVLGPEKSFAERVTGYGVRVACGPDTCLVAWTAGGGRVGAARLHADDLERVDDVPIALDAQGPVAVVWHADRFVLAARGVTFELPASDGAPVALPMPSDLDAATADVTGAVSVDGWLVVVRVRSDLERTYVLRGRSASELAPAWEQRGELAQIAATGRYVGAVGWTTWPDLDVAVVFPADGLPIHELPIQRSHRIIGASADAFLLACAGAPAHRGCLVRPGPDGIDVADRDVTLDPDDRVIGHADGFYCLHLGAGWLGERLDRRGLPLPEAFPAGELPLLGIHADTALVALGPDRFLLAFHAVSPASGVRWRSLRYRSSEDLR